MFFLPVENQGVLAHSSLHLHGLRPVICAMHKESYLMCLLCTLWISLAGCLIFLQC